MNKSEAKGEAQATKTERVLQLRGAGLTNKQIAAALDMPVASVRRLASVGRAKAPSNPGVLTQYWAPNTTTAPTVDWTGFHPSPYPTHPAMTAGTTDSLRRTIGLDRRLATRMPTHLIVPDTQCKPGVPLDHLLWAGRYIAERKPDVVVHLGDHWDLPSLSSYEKPGSKWFDGKRLKDDIAAGNHGLDLLMEGMGIYRPKRMVLLRGNHEDRLTRAINDNPTQLEGIIGFHMFNDVEHGWEVVDYQKPIEIDGLAYCHYFYNPNNGRPYSGNVDTMLRNIGASFVMGHQQGLRIGRRELASGHTQRGLVAGSFYQHNEEYRGPQAAFEWRGVLVLHEVKDGSYDLMEVSMNYLRRTFS